jgi:hypothetical protein
MAARSAVIIMIIHTQPNTLRGFGESVLISGMMAQSLPSGDLESGGGSILVRS